MRKLSILLLLLLTSSLIAGCGNSKDAGESTVAKASDTTTEAATTNAPTTAGVTTAVPTTVEPTTEEPITKPEETTVAIDSDSELFGKLTDPFIFSSGAGAWATKLNIYPDGSFDGNFHDSDMGDTGDDYPHGTLYYCDFSGQFGEVEKINDYTYSMKMLDIEYAQEPDTEEIKDGTKYKYFTAYGLDEAGELLVYTPTAPVSELPEKYLGWIRGVNNPSGTTLNSYGIYNVNEEEGFIEYSY